MYLVKATWWMRAMYASRIWRMNNEERVIYLTFDDGPHETVTPLVLDVLKQYNAKATFFCIGKNVVANPTIYSRILEEGHRVGNHTQHHLNGWKTDDKTYISDVFEATKYIDSDLFRPPYGRLTSFQAKLLQGARERGQSAVSSQRSAVRSSPVPCTLYPVSPAPFKIVMWDILSGDFDINISPEKCLQNVVLNATNGSIIVFHDSAKALDRLSYTLPRVLQYYQEKRYRFEVIS